MKSKKEIILKLHNIGAISFGNFTLASGMQSPIYVDLRKIISYPKLLQAIANQMWQTLQNYKTDFLCGVPYTALSIATALSLSQNIPMVMRRKEAKNYGTKKIIEGVFKVGQTATVIEDLITTGLSALQTIEALEVVGLVVPTICIFLDREQGGVKQLEQKGYRVQSVCTLTELLQTLQKEQSITAGDVHAVTQFIAEYQI